MGTITIKNVPDEIVKSFWKSLSYDDLDKNFLPKRRKRLTANWFTEEFEDKVLKDLKDPNNTTYWPFTPEEFIAEMKKW